MQTKEIICEKISDYLSAIKNICNNYPLIEVCGFLGFDENESKYIVQLEENKSTDPINFFTIDALKYLLFKEKYSMLAIFHSHVKSDEKPSEFDIKMSENCCIPFLVYALNTDKFNLYEPKNSEYNIELVKKLRKIL